MATVIPEAIQGNGRAGDGNSVIKSGTRADCYSVDSDSEDAGADRRLHYFRKTVPFLNRQISDHLLCLISGQYKPDIPPARRRDAYPRDVGWGREGRS